MLITLSIIALMFAALFGGWTLAWRALSKGHNVKLGFRTWLHFESERPRRPG